MKKVVHNLSSQKKQINALSYGLDHHVRTSIKKNSTVIEFELFFKNLLKDISNILKLKLVKSKRNYAIHVKNTKYCLLN